MTDTLPLVAEMTDSNQEAETTDMEEASKEAEDLLSTPTTLETLQVLGETMEDVEELTEEAEALTLINREEVILTKAILR
jgi:hypothetical protein